MLEILELLGEVARDDEPLDLIGPFVDLENLGIAEKLGDRVVLHEAVAAEDLDRVGGDLHRGIGGEALAHGGETIQLRQILGIGRARRLEDQRAPRLDRHGAVGQHLLDHLKATDRLAELAAARRVDERVVERPLGRADRLGGDPGRAKSKVSIAWRNPIPARPPNK